MKSTHSLRELLPGEEILTHSHLSSSQELVLTNQRIRLTKKELGSQQVSSALLENVTLIRSSFQSYLSLIYFGGILVLGGLFFLSNARNNEAVAIGSVGLSFGVGMVMIFFASRKKSLCIYCGSEKIEMEVSGFKTEELIDFIDQLESAKSSIPEKKRGIEKLAA